MRGPQTRPAASGTLFFVGPRASVADPFGMIGINDVINPALNEMVGRGQLSASKLADLIRVRAIVERFAMRSYLAPGEVQELKARYGAAPDIISYGDYFQTEIAGRYFQLEDAEFSRIVDTVRFDLISAVKIFRGKPDAFFNAVLAAGDAAYRQAPETWSQEQEEAAHLFVLCNYYRDLDLSTSVIATADEDWFNGFLNAESVAVG